MVYMSMLNKLAQCPEFDKACVSFNILIYCAIMGYNVLEMLGFEDRQEDINSSVQ